MLVSVSGMVAVVVVVAGECGLRCRLWCRFLRTLELGGVGESLVGDRNKSVVLRNGCLFEKEEIHSCSPKGGVLLSFEKKLTDGDCWCSCRNRLSDGEEQFFWIRLLELVVRINACVIGCCRDQLLESVVGSLRQCRYGRWCYCRLPAMCVCDCR